MRNFGNWLKSSNLKLESETTIICGNIGMSELRAERGEPAKKEKGRKGKELRSV